MTKLLIFLLVRVITKYLKLNSYNFKQPLYSPVFTYIIIFYCLKISSLTTQCFHHFGSEGNCVCSHHLAIWGDRALGDGLNWILFWKKLETSFCTQHFAVTYLHSTLYTRYLIKICGFKFKFTVGNIYDVGHCIKQQYNEDEKKCSSIPLETTLQVDNNDDKSQ